MHWYILENGNPVFISEDKLKEKIASKTISHNTLVKEDDGTEHWVTLSNTHLWRDENSGAENDNEDSVKSSVSAAMADYHDLIKRKTIRVLIIFALVAAVCVIIYKDKMKPFSVKEVDSEILESSFSYNEQVYGDSESCRSIEKILSSCGFEVNHFWITNEESDYKYYHYNSDPDRMYCKYNLHGYANVPKSRYAVGYRISFDGSWSKYDYDACDSGAVKIELVFSESDGFEKKSWDYDQRIITITISIPDKTADFSSDWHKRWPNEEISVKELNREINKELKKFFEQQEIKEKLLIEKQARGK